MSELGIIAVLVVLVAAITPLLAIKNPSTFGPVGVVLLTLGGLATIATGRSAMAETTAAVLFVGAFCVAILVAIYRLLEARK